ncbi:MAG TPA: hypothetical protein VG269_08815 [Tepidisphaeraceae bacterium]|jgi:hypothetical protein|nr:hypothetical protein [Tepidisphaeraceae bacterium]
MPNDLPGTGFLGWLGRQVGHVRKAIHTDPAKPEPKVIYRQNSVEEAELPDKPGMKLRRTTIDEVIVDRPAIESPKQAGRE